MSLRDHLRDVPVPPLDLDAIVARGERLRIRRKAMFAGLAVTTVLAVLVAATWLSLLTPPKDGMHVGPARLTDTVELNVYLDDRITAELRNTIGDEARVLEGFVTLRYVTKNAAFAEFKEIYRTQPEFWESLPINALPARFVVTLENESYLASAIRDLRRLPGVDEVRRAEIDDESDGPACPASRGGSGWTSPETLVASGEHADNAWTLCARTSMNHPSDNDREALCINWAYGQPEGTGYDCGYIGNASLDENYFFAFMGPESGYIAGAVPSTAASIELESRQGENFAGEIYPAPDQLGVPFQFFTLFAEPYAEGTLVVRDAEGAAIREREMDHGLSVLTVELGGSGGGKVVGYRPEQLSEYERCETSEKECRRPQPTWIDCGDRCSAGLADAEIVLVAGPSTGSDFLGWSGACSGTEERCYLTVDERLQVTARFEASP